MTDRTPLFGGRIRLDRLGDFETDAAESLDFARRNKKHLKSWLPPLADDYYTEAYWNDSIEKSVARETEGESVDFIIRDRDAADGGRIMGTITFSQIARGAFQACYLGYDLDHTHEGNGLMQEALTLSINYAFNDLKLHRIMANFRPENTRSAKTLKALRFITEGVAKEYLYCGGAWRDHILTSLTNPAGRPEAR